MSWDKQEASERISDLIKLSPKLEVKKYREYLPMYKNLVEASVKKDLPVNPPLFNLKKSEAIIVDTVQIYASIVNYDDYRLECEKETLNSHERALRFLHLYYSIADFVAENSFAQRVDFHGSRVHVVTLEEDSDNRENFLFNVSPKTISNAIDFIWQFSNLAQAVNRDMLNNEFEAKFRFGVDVGTCVAINNGSGNENEPLFLGNSANNAAKLAEGGEPGMYLSDKIQKILGEKIIALGGRITSDNEKLLKDLTGRFNQQSIVENNNITSNEFIKNLFDKFNKELTFKKLPVFTKPIFRFKPKKFPLSNIKYTDITPSNSIRMPLVSLYADLSGYTNYIDNCISSGNIDEAVKALFVIRSEFQNVVEKDFSGRKVRFIGDCIHAIIANGSNDETDLKSSVSQSALCAGGLWSSFLLCKDKLGNIEELGLAIGIEIGETPVSRIGIQGPRSVRVASSGATIVSEKMQRDCGDNGVKFGPDALSNSSRALIDFIKEGEFEKGVGYSLVLTCIGSPTLAKSKNVNIIYNTRTNKHSDKNYSPVQF